MIKILLFLSAASLLNAWGGNNREAGLDNREYSHYDIQLKIIPDKQFIKVSGGLKFLVMEDGLDELTFNLHKKMEIGDFSITQWPSWSANVIGADWVEMGLYFPWYPSVYGLFTYSVSVEIEPDYKVFALGQSTEKGNKKVFKTEFPVDDFIICAAKELTIRETKLLNRSFQIVNCTLSEATVDSIQADIEDCYRLFSSWFGEIQVHDMCLVASKRAHGGGYSRKGGLFLGGLSDSNYVSERMDHVLYLGHEIAHFWWNGAAGDWEDWLNESYAEYSALLLIREFRSKEEFNSRLNVKRDEGKNTPPIWGMSRSDPSAEQVLYGKGAVLLSELEERIGHDRFLKLCQARINMKANNTPDLLTLISDIGGKETADWFEQSLKTR
jgi:hypothetical protein